MLPMTGRNASQCFDLRIFRVAAPLGLLDSRFYFPHTGKVLVQLVAVARIKPPLHVAGVGENEIENGAVLLPLAAQVFAAQSRRTRPKQPFEDLARIRLG